MFKTKKRFRKTYRKKNTKSLHSKNKKTCNKYKLKHKKTHKKKIQRGGGLKCNTKNNLSLYVVMGHGESNLTLIDIPTDCVYVSFTELLCITFTNNPFVPIFLNNIFDPTSVYRYILKNPCKYWSELKEKFSNTQNEVGINIHHPDENPEINQYVDVTYTLFTYMQYGDNSQIFMSGIYDVTRDVDLKSQKYGFMIVKDSDIIDPAIMEFAYKDSILPTFADVMTIINSYNGMTYNQFNAYAKTKLRITQSDLFNRYPGIFYNILCKAIDPTIANQGAVIDTAAILRRRSIDASREIDAKNIFLAYVSLSKEEIVERTNKWPGALRQQTQYGCEINCLLFLNLITTDQANEIMDQLEQATTIIARHITLSYIINNIFKRNDLFEITYDTTVDAGDTTGVSAIQKISNLYNYILNELPNGVCILIKLNRMNYLGHTIILMKYSNNLFSYDPQFINITKNIVRLQASSLSIFNNYYLKNGFVSATIIYCHNKSDQLIRQIEPMEVIQITENIVSSGGGGGPVLSGVLNCSNSSSCTSENLIVTQGSSSGGGTATPCYKDKCNQDSDYESDYESDENDKASSIDQNTQILTNIYKAMGIADTIITGPTEELQIEDIKNKGQDFLKYTVMHKINNMLENGKDVDYLTTTLSLAGLDIPQNLSPQIILKTEQLKKYFETKNIDEIYDNISLDLFKRLFQ